MCVSRQCLVGISARLSFVLTRRSVLISSSVASRRTPFSVEPKSANLKSLEREDRLCVYHPAPFTRPRVQDGRLASEAITPSLPIGESAVGAGCRRNTSVYGADERTCYDNNTTLIPDTGPSTAVCLDDSDTDSRRPIHPNFLGPTSYPSVFAHSWKIGAAGSHAHWQAPLDGETHIQSVPGQLDADRVHTSTRMLELFDSIPDIEVLITRFYGICDFVFIPASVIFRSLKSIKSTIQVRLHADGQLRSLASAILPILCSCWIARCL